VTSKLPWENHSQEKFQIMFHIYVHDQKVQGKGPNIMFLKLFLNAMIRNIEIHNILDILEISKSLEPNKCTYLNVSYDFSKYDGSKKIKV
jgi:hypothetical protein